MNSSSLENIIHREYQVHHEIKYRCMDRLLQRTLHVGPLWVNVKMLKGYLMLSSREMGCKDSPRFKIVSLLLHKVEEKNPRLIRLVLCALFDCIDDDKCGFVGFEKKEDSGCYTLFYDWQLMGRMSIILQPIEKKRKTRE